MFCLLVLGASHLQGQKLYPLVQSTFYPDNLTEFQSYGAFAQDTNGIMYVGFSYGVFDFDGQNKSLLTLDSPVLKLNIYRPQNRIVVACQNHFGYIVRQPDGALSYRNLAKRTPSAAKIDEVDASIEIIGESAYFYYDDQLFRYDFDRDSVFAYKIGTGSRPSLGMFRLGNRLLVNHAEKGLCSFVDGVLKPASSDSSLNSRRIIFSVVYDKQRVLLGTRDQKLFLSDGQRHTPYASDFSTFVQALQDGGGIVAAEVNDSHVIISTRQNGAFFLNRQSGQLESILNIRYGLPENEINATFHDRDGRLWLAHNEKISWAYIGLPLNRYEKGLSGNINSIIYTDNIYIATDNGVYYSVRFNTDQVSDQTFMGIINQFKNRPSSLPAQQFDPLAELQKVAQEVQSTSIDFSQSQNILNQAESQNKVEDKGGVLRKLFQGKKGKEEEQRLAEERRRAEERRQQELAAAQQKAQEAAQAIAAEAARKSFEEMQRIQREAELMRQREIAAQQRLASVYAEVQARRQEVVKNQDYERVIGFPEEKVNALVSFQGRLLAGSVNGLYEIANARANRVLSYPAKLLCVSQKHPNRVYAVTPQNYVGVYLWNGYVWSHQTIYYPNVFINSIAEDEKGQLWLGTSRGARLVQNLDEPPFSPKSTVLIPSKDTTAKTEVTVLQAQNRVLIVQDLNLYVYNGSQFERNKELSQLLRPNVRVMLAQGKDLFWFSVGRRLYKLKLNPQAMTVAVLDSTHIFQLSERLSTFHVDPSNTVWTGSQNMLLSFDHNAKAPRKLNDNFSAVFKSIKIVENSDGKLIKRPVEDLASLLDLPYQSGYSFEFEFTAASFDNPTRLRFEYKIGESDQWKELDINRLSLEFGWGKHKFQVRAIDAFGNISQPAVFLFRINSPYWAKWYFWLMIVLVIGLSVFKFVQVRQKQLIQRKEELEREVAKATIEIREKNAELEAFNVQLKQQSELLQDQNEKLEQSNIEINRQKDISEKLLLNILPHQTAEELKQTGRAVARKYQTVSVLFSDLKGFTKVTENMTPEQLVVELDRCFLAFDEILDKYNLEKIKTMGDGYMCAGGIPIRNNTNPVDAVLAALEMQRVMNKLAEDKRKRGEPCWEIRIGIHTGELVAGVVGKKKFAYDIWGDTVNLASRMESSGEPGRVNVSETTYLAIKDYFTCTFRGKVPAKNKGDIAMYFVDGIKPELSVQGKGVEPNDAFQNKYSNLAQINPPVLSPQS